MSATPSAAEPPRALGLAAARAALRAVLKRPDPSTPGQVERVGLTQAAGRVLAFDVTAPHDVPPHDNAAMDGYAFDGRALASAAAGGECVLPVLGSVRAGAPWPAEVPTGCAVKVMTGAVMPAGCDTVVPVERCSAEADRVRFEAAAVRPGDHRRRRGEDLARGRPALTAGRVLRAADLGLAASVGLAELPVHRRLRVALFSTGDELREPGEPLPAGCIYDSNRRSLAAAVQALGAEVVDLGRVADDPAALRAALQQGVAQADVVLTSGGVSQGDADHTRDVLAAMGTVHFCKVALRPGQPFAFGVLRGAETPAGNAAPIDREVPLLALPGNPVAALVSFLMLARDALQRLAGADVAPPLLLRATCRVPVDKRRGRTEVLRGIVERADDGSLQVRTTGPQGSGILSSFTQCNALIVLDEALGPVAAGDAVEVWLTDALG